MSVSTLIDPRDAPHIFRDAPGHISDTELNRALLIEPVKPEHRLGTDRFANSWYAREIEGGRQVWAVVRGERIRNGGVNGSPRAFDSLIGLSAKG